VNGTWVKKMRKKYGPYKHGELKEVQTELNFVKPVRLALKHAKKVLKEMRKGDPNSECGLWYDINDGCGYKECCRAGGGCYWNGKMCPFLWAKGLIAALTQDGESAKHVLDDMLREEKNRER